MTQWLDFVKGYAETHNIPYKQALKDASPAYKTRNETIQKVMKQPEVIPEPETKTIKKKSSKKVVEKISVKL